MCNRVGMGNFKQTLNIERKTVSQDDSERRIQFRVGTRCQCWMSRDSVTLLGKVVNLSIGGLFLQCTHHLSVGSTVELSLNIEDQTILSWGRVVWTSNTALSGGLFGMGVAFDRFIHGQEFLLRFISERTLQPSLTV